ncbi:unnamed protein product [Rotaria sp. Silwood2]|nr:unnamed protein product [Rotaria sp. Silwood2]CAF3492750.1 unnamed protein product [Rotaria sp. Silwood2]CAF4583359.1 unnamed protein product [Rotaria sp. Silwood2]CAF4679721.1 unnamed protein product [Rotaria sp. Silwood2]CAF4704004.1 unnamed protein product [Rotaria sp. Silwood2]
MKIVTSGKDVTNDKQSERWGDTEIELSPDLIHIQCDVHSPELFYPAVGLKPEELLGRLQIEHRLAKNEKFQD